MAHEIPKLRDLGEGNPFSMKDGVIFRHPSYLCAFGLVTFITQWNYHFKILPRRYKVHRSLHPYVLFAGSVYLPYRYSEHINTVILSLTKSSNPYLNKVVKIPAKLMIYGASIFVGQLLARWYWVYKRSFNATKLATLNTYYFTKIYSNTGPFKQAPAFDEIRPKLVS